MAGGFSSMRGGGLVQQAAAAAVVLMLAVSAAAGARPVHLKDSSTCPTADDYVYPYWSFCDAPAELGEKYHYVLAAAGFGGLEPEYDESNATYYVRFTDAYSYVSSGAAYVAVAGDSEESGTLLVNSTVYIYNAESKRVLQWRQEGSDEYFLIEKEVSISLTEGAPFRFLQAKTTSSLFLPCPLTPPAECQTYYLVSDPASSASFAYAGLLAYAEEGVTYVKAAPTGSTGDLPLLIQRTSSSAAAMHAFPTIRTVTRDQ